MAAHVERGRSAKARHYCGHEGVKRCDRPRLCVADDQPRLRRDFVERAAGVRLDGGAPGQLEVAAQAPMRDERARAVRLHARELDGRAMRVKQAA